MKEYFVITASDGEHSIELFSKEELHERINNPDYYGSGVEFLSEVPDMDYMGNRDILIIKGKIITPRPAEVVKIFEIDG
jgi:hypothetical protein